MPEPKCRLCRDYGYIEVPDFSTGAPSTQVEPCPSCTEVDGVAASLGCGLLLLGAVCIFAWALFR